MHSLSKQSRNRSAVHKSAMSAKATDKISTGSNKAKEPTMNLSSITHW